MKLVKEYINEKFAEDSDPIEDMGIGIRRQLELFLKPYSLSLDNAGQYKSIGDVCMHENKYDFVSYLLDNKYININYVSNKNDYREFGTYLQNTAYNQNWSMMKFLIDNGADLEKTIECTKRVNLPKTLERLLEFKNMLQNKKI